MKPLGESSWGKKWSREGVGSWGLLRVEKRKQEQLKVHYYYKSESIPSRQPALSKLFTDQGQRDQLIWQLTER